MAVMCFMPMNKLKIQKMNIVNLSNKRGDGLFKVIDSPCFSTFPSPLPQLPVEGVERK